MNNSAHIHIGTVDKDKAFDRFVDAWHRAEKVEIQAPEVHLKFEDLATLLSPPRRFEILKHLRRNDAMSIRALSKALDRGTKDVHSDVRALEEAGLVERTEACQVQIPWGVIDARLSLLA